MVDRIVQGQGVGRSIKSAISDKTTARVTRMKAKFDPMNIGKAFGGKLGAYAVGKMTGRSQEDMAYFTGARIRSSSMENMKVNPLVTKVSDGDQTKMKKNDGLADVMARIYNLIKNNSDEQKRQLEIDKNLNVDREKQREKWHSDLIHALTGSRSVTVTATPAKKENGGIFDTLMKMVEDFVKPLMEKINEWKLLLAPIFDFLGILGKGAIQILLRLGGFLLSPLGAALIAGASLLALLAMDKNPKSTTEGIINAGATDGGMAEAIMSATEASDENAIQAKKNNLLANRTSSEKSFLPWKDSDLQKDYLEKIGWDEKSGTTKKERSGGAVGIDETGKLILKKTTATPMPSEKTTSSTGSPTTASAMSSNSNGSDSSSGAPSSSATTTPESITASPMPPAPADTGTRVQSAIGQNIDMNLDQGSSKIIAIDNSKTVNASGGSSGPAISMDSSVMVRTDDPTLQNILKKIIKQV